MAEAALNISYSLRQGLIDLFRNESTGYWLTNFTRNGEFYVYEEPFEATNVTNFPALAIYDMTDISFTQEQFILPARENFVLELSAQKATWREARDIVSKDLLSARLTIRDWKQGDPGTDLMQLARDITITSVAPIGAVQDGSRMWTYMAQINFYIDYEEGFYPDC
jgi:hypothetical protein